VDWTGGEGARLSVSTSDVLKQTQIECEYPFRSQNEMAVVGKLISHVSGLRKSGSTALDLCHLARGQKMCVLSSRPCAARSGGGVPDCAGKRRCYFRSERRCGSLSFLLHWLPEARQSMRKSWICLENKEFLFFCCKADLARVFNLCSNVLAY
jgi:hypothetical protein